jgi:hypothetical protein
VTPARWALGWTIENIGPTSAKVAYSLVVHLATEEALLSRWFWRGLEVSRAGGVRGASDRWVLGVDPTTSMSPIELSSCGVLQHCSGYDFQKGLNGGYDKERVWACTGS